MKVLVLAGFSRSLVNLRGDLLRQMALRGHEVVACGPAASDLVVANLKAMNVRFREVPLERTGLNPMNDLKTMRQLEAVFRDEKPDKFLGYTIKPVIYGTLAAARAGVPERYAMITGMGSTFEPGGLKQSLLTGLVKRLYKRALVKVERIIVQNPDDKNDIVRYGLASEQKIRMVNGSGVDCSKYSAKPASAEPLRFLCISRLIADKGVREFAFAARDIRAKFPHVEFDLVGPIDPNPSAISEAEVKQWVESGWLNWHGFQEDVRPFIERCSVYVLPSYREGTPRTVLEAMAMQRPVITTDAPGCRETIRDGVEGFLVKPRDADSLTAAMKRFVESPELVAEFSPRSRLRAEEKYDVHRVTQSVLEILGL